MDIIQISTEKPVSKYTWSAFQFKCTDPFIKQNLHHLSQTLS